MRVEGLLERAVATWPEKEALVVAGGERWTYAELGRTAANVRRWLDRRGGERIALLAQNGVEYVAAYYGILRAGGVVVPIGTAVDPTTLAEQLAVSGATVLMAGPRMERMVVQAGAKLRGVAALQAVVMLSATGDVKEAARSAVAKAVGEGVAVTVLGLDGTGSEAGAGSASDSGSDSASASASASDSGADDASIVFTSGSTGKPRGATLTHRGIRANVDAIVASLRLGGDERVLVVLPFYYVFGKSLLNMTVAVGGTIIVENRFQYPNVALDTLEAERCTGIAGVPSTYAILAHRSNLRERRLEHLRWMAQAGGGMNPSLVREVVAMVPQAQLFVMYGATEASARLSVLPPEELDRAVGSIGRAIPGVTLTVRRDDGSPCAVDEVGELFAQGENLMRGYWNDIDGTCAVLGPLGYATGDLARCDARGLFWLVGRKRDQLKVGGHRVSAKEIEDAIAEHEAVSEVAVIGIPDEILGDKLVAYVVLREAAPVLEPRQLQSFLSERVSSHRVPSVVELCPSLPKNESGKIMKEALRARWPAPT